MREIAVSCTYDRPPVPPGTPGNALDLGVFDQRGTALRGPGFRGWSGGFRTSFAISASEATPGYLPGPVEAGTWNIVLGPYQVAPQGLDYQVEVILRSGPSGPAFRPDYPPVRAPGRGTDWYRGDCRLHTVHSDGKRLPAEVAQETRAAGLDFIMSTEHNTSSAHAVWGQYAGDDLLIVLGEEVTTRNGHYLALGLPAGEWVDWRYRARDEEFDKVARQVSRSGGLVVPAHPYCPFVACRWKFGYAEADAIEVWNGPWTDDDEIAVQTWDKLLVTSTRNSEPWVPAMGNSDAHRAGQVVGLPHNVVLADGLDRAALLTGIRRGTSWVAESAGVRLELTVRGGGRQAGIGSHFDAPHMAGADLPRDHVARDTELGRSVRAFLDRGELVGDEVSLEMVRVTCGRPAAADGVPRMMAQAHARYEIAVGLDVAADVALHLQVPDEELVHRSCHR